MAFELNRLARINNLAAGVDSDVIQQAQSLSTKLRVLVNVEKKYWISQDKDFYQLFLKRQNEFLNQLLSLDSIISEERSRTLLTEAQGYSQSYFRGVTDRKSTGNKKNSIIYESARDETIKALYSSLDKIEQATNRARDEKIRESGTISSKVLWLTFAFAAVCVGLSIIVSLLTMKRIARPIELFQRKTRDIAAGNFTRIERLRAPMEISMLADEFNAMSERLQELDRLKEDYVSHLSHTLRTPLTAIWEASGMLSKGTFDADPGSQAELMAIVRNECKRLIVAVNRILDLSRMESQMMDYQFVTTDLNQLISDAIARVSPIARAKNIKLHFTPQKDLPPVKVDTEQLHQLLENLIGNALKYTDSEGSVGLEANINKGKDAKVEVAVADTGRGIEAQNLRSIFDKFRRIDSGKDTTRGSGLGLAIAQHIVKAHGGSIWVESEKGFGSTFYFSLPPA